MELRVLGCSGGIGAGLRTTSLLLDRDILIDAGTGVGDLDQSELQNIRHIFLTHSHLDHIASLPLMIDTVFGFQDAPLTVHALPETIETLKQHVFNWRVWPDFAELPDRNNPSLRYMPMRHGEEIALGERIIRMIPAVHTVPAAGYIVANGSGAFAFSGDTSTNSELWRALSRVENLKLLIVECAFADEDRELSELAKHYCPQYLAGDIKQLKNDVLVAITHLKPGYEGVIMRECRAAMPGRELIQLAGGERFTI